MAIENLRNMDEVLSVLKACIVAHKGGVPKEELDDEFFKFTGMYIPYLSHGYSSLYEFLGKIPDIVKERNEQNELVYKVSTQETAHIADMIEKQKDSTGGMRWTKATNSWNNKVETRPNRYSKRKAVNEGRSSRRTQKRPRNDANTRLRDWNQIYDPNTSSDGEGYHSDNHRDCVWDFSDYDRWYEEEYNHHVNIVEKPPKLDVVYEPIVSGKLLIGDDFFLQLAIRNVGVPIWRKEPNTALHSGLCVSGQTIKECTRSLSKVQAVANKVVILLGAEDIYRCHSVTKMIEDMENLLSYLESNFALSRSAITLCTIPPLANLGRNSHANQLRTLHAFNDWIRKQTNADFQYDGWDYNARYNLIELFSNNTTTTHAPAYDYFQMDARMVSGSRYPYVLWNLRGRRLAMTLLRGGSC